MYVLPSRCVQWAVSTFQRSARERLPLATQVGKSSQNNATDHCPGSWKRGRQCRAATASVCTECRRMSVQVMDELPRIGYWYFWRAPAPSVGMAPSPCSPAQLQIGGTRCSSAPHLFCSGEPVSESRLSPRPEPVWLSRFDLAIWRGRHASAGPVRSVSGLQPTHMPPTCRNPGRAQRGPQPPPLSSSPPFWTRGPRNLGERCYLGW